MKIQAHTPTVLARLTLALLMALLWSPTGAVAQAVTCDGVGAFPCGYQIKDVALQRVPALFKLQARVAQAKLPVGEGLFQTVVVKLLRGTEVLCMETFAGVQVRESVLNLEIGRNMSCEMDDVIAENNDLAFQVCLGGPENCLKPVDLAATPYAVKSSYAYVAQTANLANQAAVAHYAHRLTADRDLHTRKELGTGYFDFYTHEACESVWSPQGPTCEAQKDGGFLQWTPVKDPTAFDLTIVGKNKDLDTLRELDTLTLASERTTATGDLTVEPSENGLGLTVTAQGAHVTGASDVFGTLTVSDRTIVLGDGIHVTGASEIFGTLYASEATTVGAGGIHVTGASDITGATTITGATLVTGTLGVSQATTVQAGGIHVTGASDITGATQVTGTLGVSGATTVSSGGVHVAGDSDVTGAWSQTGDSTFVGAMGVQGPVTVDGVLDARQGLTVGGGQPDGYAAVVYGGLHTTAGARIDGMLAVHESIDDPVPDLTFDVNSGLMVEAGGAHVNGDSSLGGTLTIHPDPLKEQFALVIDGGGVDVNNADLAVDGSVYIENGSLFVGPAHTLSSNAQTGNMIVSGPVTFTSAVVFEGGSSTPNPAYVLINGESRPVTLSGTLSATGQMSALGGLLVANTLTVTTGTPPLPALFYSVAEGLKVSLGGLHVTGVSDFSAKVTVLGGGVAVTGASVFNNLLTAAAGVAVTGASSIAGKLTISTGGLGVTGTSAFSDKLTVAANGVDVTGASTFRSAVTVTGGGVAVTGASSVAGKLTVSSGGAAVTGPSSFSDKLTVAANGVDVTGASTFRNAVAVTGGGVAVTGASSVAGKLTVSSGGLAVTGTSALSDKVTVAANGVDVTGASTFRNAVTVSAGGVAVTGASSIAGALTVSSGGIAVTGASSVAGKLTVSSGGAAVTGTSSFSDKLTVAANGVDVTGASTFRNALNVAAGGIAIVAGGLGIGAGGLTVKGGTTADDVTVSGTLDIGYEIVTCNNVGSCLCPSGKKALSGGVSCSSNNHHVHDTMPGPMGTSWTGSCENSVGTNQVPGSVYAVCARLN